MRSLPPTLTVLSSRAARILVEENAPHDQLVATIRRLPFFVKGREAVMRQICCSGPDGSFQYAAATDDTVVVDYGTSVPLVRVGIYQFVSITPVGDGNQCLYTMVAYVSARSETEPGCSSDRRQRTTRAPTAPSFVLASLARRTSNLLFLRSLRSPLPHRRTGT
jgi:hypothetical protein